MDRPGRVAQGSGPEVPGPAPDPDRPAGGRGGPARGSGQGRELPGPWRMGGSGERVVSDRPRSEERELPAYRGQAHREQARHEQALRDGGGRAARYPPLSAARGVLGGPGLDLYRAQGIQEVEGGRVRAREVDLLRRVPDAPGLWRV